MNRNVKISHKNLRIIFSILGVIILTCVGVVVCVISAEMDKINFLDEKEMAIPDNLDDVVIESESDVDVTSDTEIFTDADMEESASDAAVIEVPAGVSVDADGLRYAKGVKNVLLLGTDNRNMSLKSRTDVMIILSINDNTKKITMSSLMRDTYVTIPGKSKKNKLNAANAFGGPALAVKTVETNYGIKIDNVVVVNFYSFMDIVDALGGVTLDVTKSELKVMNQYIEDLNKEQGQSPNKGKLQYSGKNIKLTGRQALGYVRNRYVGHGDYERTNRQRKVLTQIIEKVKTAGVTKLTKLLDKVTKNMSTDMSQDEILSYISNAAEYVNYEVDQIRIPIDGTYKGGTYNGAWTLRIDFEKNKKALYEKIFGE